MNFSTTAETAVKLPENAKIVLAEGTTNTIASTANDAYMSYGIYATGGLTIEGSGTLTVRSAKATPSSDDGESYGIYADDGDITISGGTVEATGGESSFCSSGIYADNGYITISGGTVIAASGTASLSYGIISDQTITISGGAVNATGGISDAFSGGIGATNVEISGGTVTAKGGQATGESYGIYGESDVEISGGVVTATGSTADFGSYGIWAIRVAISGGVVNATGDTAEKYCYGIYASCDVIPISGDHVIARTPAQKSAENQAALVTPNLDGYTGGYYWRISSEDSFAQTAYTYSDTDTYVEFSSQDTVTTYTVTVQNDGNGSATATPATAAAGTEITLSATANSGYHFKEWQVISGTVAITDNKFTMPDSNVTVKAIFEADAPSTTTYTITFNANGGSGEMTAETTNGDYTLPTCTFTASEGKQFKGWATSENGAVITDDTITVTDNTTLYAIWEVPEHSMPGYHAILEKGFEDGFGGIEWKSEDMDEDTYDWEWGKKESDSDPYNPHHGNSVFYSASYVDRDGALKPDNRLYSPKITIGGGYKLTFCLIAQDPSKEGDLLGVYITDDLVNFTQIGTDYKATKEWVEYTVDLSDYAGKEAWIAFVHHNCEGIFRLNLDCVYIWAPDHYTVTFDPNGGTLTGWPDTETEPDGTVDYLPRATREGYTFDGWYTEKDGGEKVYTYVTVFTADTTVYAHWTPEADTKQITEASFAMKGYTVGADAKNIVITSHTEGLSLAGGYFEALGKPYSYLIAVVSGDDYAPITGALEAEKEYILMLKADVNAGYDVSGLAESAVTLNSTITADDCSVLKEESTLGISFVLPVLTDGDTVPAKNTVTVTDSYATTTGAGEYEEGDLVTLAAGTRSGYTFSGWTSDDITIPNAGSADTSFVMPAKAVTVTANWTRIGGSSGSSGGGSSTPTYAPSVTQPENGAVTVSPKAPKTGDTVTITPKPEDGYTVEQILVTDKNGDPVEVTNNGDGTFSFTQPAGKVNVEVTFMEDNSMLNFFVDVPAGAYYYDAVLWAAENGITGGTSATTFSPDEPCTRAQIVTFLWRAAGSPEPKTVSSFADVPADSYYAKAVAWAVENGITTGTGDGMFSPNATCTRAQAMTFLWRAAGSPAASGSGFSDVSSDAYYANAVAWAVQRNITSGTGNGQFSPDADCTRAQIVTFLYRCLG